MMDAPTSGASWLDPAPTDGEEALASADDDPYLDGYRDLLARLTGEGFRLRATCLAAPIQFEGFLPTGEAMYFRCRYDTCRLDIAPRDQNPVRSPAWTASVSRWAMYEAGALEAGDAEAVLRELLALFRAGDPGDPPG